MLPASARALALAAGLVCCAVAQAQLTPPDPDWQELEVPAPPPLRTDHLVAIDLPGSTLQFGVDPSSVLVGRDGIVRYVVVATSGSGAVNGFYEGIRCSTGEVRTYARHAPDSGWVVVKHNQWQSLHGSRPSRHSLAIARNGACIGSAPNQNAGQVVRDLGGNHNRRGSNN